MKILIGSSVLHNHFPEFRKPKDTDYAVDEVFPNEKGIEYLYNPIICSMYNDGDEISLSHLLSLKASHLHYDINWDKHMWDVQFLLKKGYEIDEPLFLKLRKFWTEHHGKKRKDRLKKTAEEFFDNGVDSPYDHDWLHTLMQDPPTFTLILKEGKQVETSRSKFEALTEQQKCDLTFEEVCVMGFERYRDKHYRVAYHKMLKKFIIGHAPSWQALHIIKNFHKIRVPKFNFINHLNTKINETEPRFKNIK